MAAPTPAQIQELKKHAHDTKVADILASNIICTVIAYTAVALRFGSRRIVRIERKADDWLIVVATFFFTGFTMGYVALTKYGGGRHIILVTDPKALAETFTVISCCYVAAMTSIKLSILYLYNRIFQIPWFRLALKITALFIFCWFLAGIFCICFQCVPFNGLWDLTVHARCIDFGKSSLALSVINIVTDFTLLFLPMQPVWILQQSTRRKWALTATFTIGCCACIISIVRLAFIEKVGLAYDSSWTDIVPGMISTAELCVGIFAACIPTYVPLLRKVAEQRSLASRLIESKSRRTGGSSRTQTVKTGFSSTNHGTEMWSKAKEDRSWVSVGEDDDRLELGKHQGPSSFA